MVKHEKHHRGPRINANVVVGLLRREWVRLTETVNSAAARFPTLADASDFYDTAKPSLEQKLLTFAKTIASGLTDEQVLSIAQGKARLVGVTPGPIAFEKES